MSKQICSVKRKLSEAVEQLCKVSWMFIKNPERDFTRQRKLSFRDTVSFLLCAEGGSLTKELLRFFGCRSDTATSSALIQQRNKIDPAAFSSLFDLFVSKTDKERLYKGFRLFAADGTDIQIPTNSDDAASYYPGAKGQAPYNILHLDAVYDLLCHTYQDAILSGDRLTNEVRSLCRMVDRSPIQQAIVLADRGYESYNLMAHIQEKGWKFLIRIREKKGMASGFELPDTAEFDRPVYLSITKQQTKAAKELCKDKNHYRFVPATLVFDYLPQSLPKYSELLFYRLSFRIVRFLIAENTYETIVTNLPQESFPPQELKRLYALRWGIETAFRELKYTIGLLHFHAKKVEYIYQEIFARLIMYNFTEQITSSVILRKESSKFAYRANFSVAVHVCRQFLLGNVSPPQVEALIQRNVSPIRPGRSSPRNLHGKPVVSFLYRIA